MQKGRKKRPSTLADWRCVEGKLILRTSSGDHEVTLLEISHKHVRLEYEHNHYLFVFGKCYTHKELIYAEPTLVYVVYKALRLLSDGIMRAIFRGFQPNYERNEPFFRIAGERVRLRVLSRGYLEINWNKGTYVFKRSDTDLDTAYTALGPQYDEIPEPLLETLRQLYALLEKKVPIPEPKYKAAPNQGMFEGIHDPLPPMLIPRRKPSRTPKKTEPAITTLRLI